MRREEAMRRLAAAQGLLKPFRVEAIYLFGSVARDEAESSSDVDLLVDFETPPSLFEFARLRRLLAGVLECPVDLVTRPALKPKLREGILREAVRAS